MLVRPSTVTEAGRQMALRTFTDRDGIPWNAWHVIPMGSGVGYQERYRAGWVCFERVGGGDRCRCPLADMPAAWEDLPDDRLDLVRRASAQAGTGTMPRIDELNT
jgi:hypothetical protein